jgi:DNA-binding FrmR family transcriptional regulator
MNADERMEGRAPSRGTRREPAATRGRRTAARPGVTGCACAAPPAGEGPERRAVAVDPAIASANIVRLRRIEGQVRGLQKMVEEQRYCADILTQISSVQEALRSVGRELMRNHLKHCATSAIRGGEDQAERMYDELIELIYKHNR